jgi:tetratricopeptide (TPR) repeat protein
MTLPRFAVLIALSMAALVAVPRYARADDAATKAAKKHYDKGEKLFNLGRYDAALDEYQKAFDAKPVPAFLFNIGQCYRNLGDFEQAVFSFKRFLKLEPDAPNRERVENLIDDLEAKMAAHPKPDKPPPPPPPPVPPAVDRPFYATWWFWTGVAVVAVAGGSVGIYEATRSSGPPSTQLGNVVFPP